MTDTRIHEERICELLILSLVFKFLQVFPNLFDNELSIKSYVKTNCVLVSTGGASFKGLLPLPSNVGGNV